MVFLRSLGLLAPVAAGGLYVAGAFGGNYSRDVDRSPAEVMAALSDLDITDEPGRPGTDPSRAGGVAPMFVLDRTADTMTWKVMSGTQVATSMTANLEPIGDGSRTRVTASVVRGDAPDDFVSPAFRSKAVTMGLFSMALETELDELTLPVGGSPEKCRQIMEQMQIDALSRGNVSDERTLGGGAQTILTVHAMAMKMRRAGCDTNGDAGEFTSVSNRMGSAGDDDGTSASLVGPSFEPGKPMIDLSKKR